MQRQPRKRPARAYFWREIFAIIAQFVQSRTFSKKSAPERPELGPGGPSCQKGFIHLSHSGHDPTRKLGGMVGEMPITFH